MLTEAPSAGLHIQYMQKRSGHTFRPRTQLLASVLFVHEVDSVVALHCSQSKPSSVLFGA